MVTPVQKEAVYKLRLQGLGYKAIAREQLLSVDAVKSYCKRHHLIGPPEAVQKNAQVIEERHGLCPQCKQPIRQKKRGRSKRFCSDACRHGWWKAHPEACQKSAAAIYRYTCQYCGKACTAYGNKNRKYCSHDCYIKARFWGEEDGI